MFEKQRAALNDLAEILIMNDEALNIDELEERLELAAAIPDPNSWGSGCTGNFCSVDCCTGNLGGSNHHC